VNDFADFFSARRDVAYRAVLVAVGDRAGAEDAVAEAFARAYQHWASVRNHPNPTAWVIRVALNVSRSWWRRRRREFLTADAHESASGAPSDDTLGGALTEAIKGLSRRQREVLALRVAADMSAEDAGHALGIATGTVHVHLHRALATLREALAEPTAQTTEAGR
jgi:RNA polymerase sigma-70 factor (ECF subfamily)